jgi:hypothetical protein
VAYNPSVNEYIVVWEGDDLAGALVEGETEIFGQRLDGATGTAVGMNDFRISDMGTDGDIEYDAAVPAVAYNSSSNQYLVAWAGEDNVGFLANGEFEIFGQRIDAAGAELGTNDFRISDMGTDGDANFDAFAPAIAADPADFQYLVVWEGEDNTGTLVNGEFEIFGQRIDAFSGAAIGVNDFRISDMGTDGDPGFDAQAPSVTFNGNAREFLVVWEGDDNSGTLVAGEVEIFAQRLVADTGAETGDNDFRLSDMGPDGDAQYDATRPAIIYAITENAYLAVWSGDDNTGLLGPNEFEIYGQAYSTGTPSGVIAGGESIARLLVSEVSPNPVGARAVVSVVVPTAGSMTMAVFDVLGRPVSREEFQAAAPGRIDLDFDTAGLANGIYLVRISEGRASATRRIVVTR